MKIKNSFFRLLSLIFILTLFTTACNNDEFNEIEANSLAAGIAQFIDIEQSFASLVHHPESLEERIAMQLVFLSELQQENSDFSIDRSISAYESTTAVDVSQNATGILDDAFEILAAYGFTNDAGQQLEQLNIDSRKKMGHLQPNELTFVEKQLQLMFFLATSPSFQKYAALQQHGVQLRDSATCIALHIYLAGVLIACTTQPYACFAIPYLALQISKHCIPSNGGGPTGGDPCANSPDPCCGSNCPSGYYCNPRTGNCISDDDCEFNPCEPGFICVAGDCIPL